MGNKKKSNVLEKQEKISNVFKARNINLCQYEIEA
jgi:hypothetical protein